MSSIYFGVYFRPFLVYIYGVQKDVRNESAVSPRSTATARHKSGGLDLDVGGIMLILFIVFFKRGRRIEVEMPQVLPKDNNTEKIMFL